MVSKDVAKLAIQMLRDKIPDGENPIHVQQAYDELEARRWILDASNSQNPCGYILSSHGKAIIAGTTDEQIMVELTS